MEFLKLFLLFSFANMNYSASLKDYNEKRHRLLMDDSKMSLGHKINLTCKEARVNEILMHFKNKEIEVCRNNSFNQFPPSVHFFHSKKIIEKSTVFSILKDMPKGAALHIHDSAFADTQWIIKNMLYDDTVYMCYMPDGGIDFHYGYNPPYESGCNWVKVNDLRYNHTSTEEFDEKLFKYLSLYVINPEEEYKSQNELWAKFIQIFRAKGNLYFSKSGLESYLTRSLQEMYDDNVQYIEIRSLMTSVYDAEGRHYDEEWLLNSYLKIFENFSLRHLDFVSPKIIYVSVRAFSNDVIKRDLEKVIHLRNKYPNLLVGYDLVGQEDPGHTLYYYINELLYPSQSGINVPYFFHAGETDWINEDVDTNLFDAILLNTTRIGHGYAITKHPKLLKLALERKVAIEVNPISNQVLGLVKDLRNHPAAELFTMDYPVVISADDPAMWGASGLSYDFYMAFMGFSGTSDLRTLKQLAINSIEFSALNAKEKIKTFAIWSKKWDEFLDKTLFRQYSKSIN